MARWSRIFMVRFLIPLFIYGEVRFNYYTKLWQTIIFQHVFVCNHSWQSDSYKWMFININGTCMYGLAKLWYTWRLVDCTTQSNLIFSVLLFCISEGGKRELQSNLWKICIPVNSIAPMNWQNLEHKCLCGWKQLYPGLFCTGMGEYSFKINFSADLCHRCAKFRMRLTKHLTSLQALKLR